MKVFKRTTIQYIKSLVIAIGGSAAVAVVLSLFLSSPLIPVIVGVVMCAALLYITVINEAIKIEVEGGEFRYFVKGKEKERFALAGCEARYHIRKSDGSTDYINVYLQPAGREDEICIDCAPLGTKQFNELWALLESQCSTPEPEKIETRKE